MSYRRIGMWLICGSLLWLGACDSNDPAAEGSGEAVAIASDKSIVIATPGDSFNIATWVLDQTSSRIGTPITLTPGASLTLQSDTFVTELAETRATIRVAAAANAGGIVTLTAEGLTDTVFVILASPGTAAGAPAFIFRSPVPVFTEDISADFGGASATILSRTPTELALLLPFGASGETAYAFEGFGPDANINVEGAVVVSGAAENEAGEPNDDFATATPAELGTDIYGAVNDDNIDDFYAFTITEAGDYVITLDWNDESDVDMAPFDADGNLLSLAGATGAQPEEVTITLAPGTYFVLVEMFARDPDATLPTTTYTLRMERLP